LKQEIDEVEDLPLWIKSNIYYLLKKSIQSFAFVCLISLSIFEAY